jgi:hypothetical protein
MKDINCPYSQLELSVAMLSASVKLQKKEAELDKMLETIGATSDKSLTELAAEHHGITKLDLINSPNMEKLIEIYQNHTFDACFKLLGELGLNNKESWAVFAHACGSL